MTIRQSGRCNGAEHCDGCCYSWKAACSSRLRCYCASAWQLRLVALVLASLLTNSAWAQTTAPDSDRSTTFQLPPAKTLIPKATAIEVVWREISVKANGLLEASEIEAITSKYRNRPLVAAREAEALRIELTLACIAKGYINSGAIITSAADGSGSLGLELVVGKITQFNVQGLARLREGYVTERLWPNLSRPLNINLLQENFQLLRSDPLLQRINSRVEPGITPGTATLELQVEEARAWSVFAAYDNLRSPSSGEYQVSAGGTMRNVSGMGDSVDFSFNRPTQGKSTSGYALGYSLPLPYIRTIAGMSYTQGQTLVTAPPFDRLNFANKSTSKAFSLTQPIVASLANTLSAGVERIQRVSSNSLDNQPFSVSLGEPNGRSEITANRLFVAWSRRDDTAAFSLRATLTRGHNNYQQDASPLGGDVPQSSYSSMLYQGIFNRRLRDDGTSFILRGSAQTSPNMLVSTERFSPTNSGAVRGYLENQFVFDNAYAVSLELLLPVISTNDWQLNLTPFIDVGRGYDNGKDSATAQRFSSYGLAMTGNYQRASFMLTLARPMANKELVTAGYRQSRGILFQVKLTY